MNNITSVLIVHTPKLETITLTYVTGYEDFKFREVNGGKGIKFPKNMMPTITTLLKELGLSPVWGWDSL